MTHLYVTKHMSGRLFHPLRSDAQEVYADQIQQFPAPTVSPGVGVSPSLIPAANRSAGMLTTGLQCTVCFKAQHEQLWFPC